MFLKPKAYFPLCSFVYCTIISQTGTQNKDEIQLQAEEDDSEEEIYVSHLPTPSFFDGPNLILSPLHCSKKSEVAPKPKVEYTRIHIENEDVVYLLTHSFAVRTRKQILAPLHPPSPTFQELR